tara:strand:+ start:429 stop:1262 length:834 start_codon:yes stop_codon:yes gene_type:complete
MNKIKKIFKFSSYLPYLRDKFSPIVATNPCDDRYTFSDLFIWRYSKDWITEYNYIPYSRLISLSDLPNNFDNKSFKIVFLSNKGVFLKEARIKLIKDIKIELSKYLDKKIITEPYGSFLIFHEKTSLNNVLNKGYISERGYISYKYKNSNTASYVHGNLDAIASNYSSVGISKLSYTKSAFLKRLYRLQYIFKKKINYELILSNPTKNIQIIELIILNKDSKIINSKILKINSLGVFINNLFDFENDYFVQIKSRIPLARPIIFMFKSGICIDVFHG